MKCRNFFILLYSTFINEKLIALKLLLTRRSLLNFAKFQPAELFFVKDSGNLANSEG